MLHARPLLLALMLLSLTSTAWAQYGLDGHGAVPGTGSAKLKRLPDTVRMQVAISAAGADAKAALARLQQKKQAAAKSLETLGAKKDSIKFSDAAMDAGADNQRRRMEMMIRQQRGGRPDPKKATAPPVTVQTMLTAEWPLTAKTSDDVLLATADLQTKIKTADLAGAKGESNLTPEQQELLEEMGPAGFDEEQQEPGVPQFMFVSPVTQEEFAKMAADAFADAKAAATRSAAATGGKLGKLRYVHSGASHAGQGYEQQYYYPGGGRRMAMQQGEASDDRPEAISYTPGHVTLEVQVHASFDLAE